MVSLRNVMAQGPTLLSLGRVALDAALHRRAGPAPSLPTPWLEEELPARPDALITAYLRHLGADPSWYRRMVPAHLFPQWAFPLAARLLVGLPYPLARVVNAGCALRVRAPLPTGQPLQVRARLESIDDDGRRVLLSTRIITGTREVPDALDAELRVLVPLRKSDGPKASPATVPDDARELAFLRLPAGAGLDFAALTGDFNPIHWVPAYARAAGFRGCILHGFGTLGRAIATLDRTVLAGEPRHLASIDVRFTRPLVLPASVGVYSVGRELYVGDAPAGGAYLKGTFEVTP